MKSQIVFLALLGLLAASCGRYEAGLESLGSSSFDDLEIPDDFEAPEDEELVTEVPVDGVTAPDPDDDVLPPPLDISLKNTLYLEPTVFQLARGPALRWDGCRTDYATQGGYLSDTSCGRAFFQPSFAGQMNEMFFMCISDAAEVAGYPQPTRVFINHLGSYNDRNARNSSSLSMHAYARAWDIVNFNLVDSQGRNHRVHTHINHYHGAQARFYDRFRDCWQESLPGNCRPGDREFRGSVGHPSSKLGGNTLHNDHIHLSYPHCAGA